MSSEHGSSTPQHPPESFADVGQDGGVPSAPDASAFVASVDHLALAMAGILDRLGAGITKAFDSGNGKVANVGRMPNALNSYTALSRQFSSLGQLKLRLAEAGKPQN